VQPETLAEIAAPKKKITSESGKNSDIPERAFFEKSLASYKNGEYRLALEGFSRFLMEYPESDFAADAALYRADCLLFLSTR
jgi:TolA-binding protein